MCDIDVEPRAGVGGISGNCDGGEGVIKPWPSSRTSMGPGMRKREVEWDWEMGLILGKVGRALYAQVKAMQDASRCAPAVRAAWPRPHKNASYPPQARLPRSQVGTVCMHHMSIQPPERGPLAEPTS